MQVPRIAARAGSEEKQPAGLALWLQALVAELLLFAKIVLLAFEHVWEKPAVCHSQASMEGSTVVVTGATSGVGRETALELARRGARVVIGCRNLQKARRVAQEIFDRTQQRVIVKHLDMNSLKSVRHFCDDVIKTEDRLDVLINNAGAIGHLLKKSSPSRVINVASDFHRLGEVGSVADKARGVNSVANPTAVYGNAKLALCMVTVALADRLRGTGVTVNSLHPGAVKTHIVDEGPGVRKFLFELILSIKGKTPQEGAQTSVRLAVDPALEQTSGEYFENCAPAAARYRSAHLADHRLADEVLRSSLELLGWRW
ncbi:retinol dehydrogenase 14-like isoform X2 [Dermacentor albipictus]|uniref:retinol dehydrogenase 14-like isoform X2 n=1 Tax=Dermacentor albipictus TaxID=60249 RepID=UPI0031FBD0D8